MSGFEIHDGHKIGRDPRRMSKDELIALGHEPISALKALRLRCIDCCAGNSNEVRKCMAVECPTCPFRMGSSPWRAELTEAQREARVNNAKR
jgi:hypothetical protein